MSLAPDNPPAATPRRRAARWRLVAITYTACGLMALLLTVEPNAQASRSTVLFWVAALFLCTAVILAGSTILISGGPNE